MQVHQRMNNQPAFGARNVEIAKDIYLLGKETVQAVKEALPSIRKMGGDNTDFFIYGDTKRLAVDLTPKDYLFIAAGKYTEPKNILGKFSQKIKLNSFVDWADSVAMRQPTKKENIIQLAKAAVEQMEAEITEKEAIANSNQSIKEAKKLMDELQQEMRSK